MSGPVDLSAVRAGLDRIDRVLRDHPDVRARTADYLRGALPALPSEVTPVKDQPVKLPVDLLDAAQELVGPLGNAPALRAFGRPTRSLVLRLALTRGLDVLRAELAAAAPPPSAE